MNSEIDEVGSHEHSCLIKDMGDMLRRAKLPELESNCCIYKVPEGIRKANPAAYTPKVVSIGPLHHVDEVLKRMEELKLGYLKSYLGRTTMNLEECIEKLNKKEEYIRSCYAKTIWQSSNDFVKMILIDACFIIEYLLRLDEDSKWSKIDSILKKQSWVDVFADLILLENQLPFFVLEDFFALNCFDDKYSSFLELSTARTSSTLVINDKLENEYNFNYFRKHHLKESWPNGKREEIKVLHLTDLVRICYLPRCELQAGRETQYPKHLYSASQLVEVGVEFRVCNNKSLTELEFEKGVLTMPNLHVNSLSKAVFLNMAALEQCHYPDETYIGIGVKMNLT